MLFNKSKLNKRLLEEDNCPKELLPNIIEKIENFSEETLKLFDVWMETGKIEEFEVNKITPKWLRENKDMKDIGILIAHDWLLKEGETAAELLRQPLR